MDVQVKLDRDRSLYSNGDTVTGEIILLADCSMSISRLVVTLSCIAISRATSGKKSEVHQLLQKSHQIFPSGMTLCKGRHAFAFSITFPHVAECYTSSLGRNGSEFRYAQYLKRSKVHLLRRLPPSMTDTGTAAEIKYSLKVIVKARDFPLVMKSKQTRDILYIPLSNPLSAQRACAKRQYLNIDPNISGLPEPVPWQVDAELLNGPCLCIGQSIPLRIQLTKLCGDNCNVWLNDFQTMLIETTQARAQDSVETFDRFWIVQTVASMEQRLCDEDASFGTIVDLPKTIWSSHALSPALLPSFEVCHIKRTFELELRLGLRIGLAKTQAVIREFRFPVHIIATEFPRSWLLSGPASQISLSPFYSPSLDHEQKHEDYGPWKEIGWYCVGREDAVTI